MDINLSLSLSLSLLPILLLATPTPVPPIHTRLALTGLGAGATGTGHRHRLSYYLSLCISALTLCLGLQTPLNPTALNQGEYPACAALTTGYVFRVENAATVAFLQKMTRTGWLTRFVVRSVGDAEGEDGTKSHFRSDSQPRGSGTSSNSTSQRRSSSSPHLSMACLPTIALLSWIISSTCSSSDAVRVSPPLVLSFTLLLLSRVLATIAFLERTRTRANPQWHGAPEPGVPGDLLILLSEDRWARMTGPVDDLKAVTSGRWLACRRSEGPAPRVLSLPVLMGCLDWMASMMVWMAVVALGGASDLEKATLVGAVIAGHLILVYENARAEELVMNGRIVRVAKAPDALKRYARRLDMAEELIREVGRGDFAVRLGMINPEQVQGMGKDHGNDDDNDETRNEVVTM
ncbi:hypothetical protein G647_00210 [Cladophialophora carrionii CBS 160.54]|uniref:Uncharacterized protein n=1 Tax=Cladophialophora carrionii CBS 160.54 TaxID=1279043 RepID=V9DM70_9EURO|nr:uncharacterized protein G647_00210 [Cladophialophora carrionii CBS 160.54]ETI27761.1 hypothetical protein G647_00210 [Cladophialophora carrionii CBS 160.54]